MSFKKGIIPTNRITITSDTTLSDVLSAFKEDNLISTTYKISENTNVKITESITIEDQPFNLIFIFRKDGRLLSIRFSPVLEQKECDARHSSRRAAHRKFCAEWLEKHFNDVKGEEQTIKAYFRSNYDFCDGDDHGYICIDYNIK